LGDPTNSSSGSFGADVAALKLDIDFADAGFTLGASGIPFGNLVLANLATLPNLNGLTVRQFLGDANMCLGGGACIYGVTDLDPIVLDLTASFFNDTPQTFAQDHLNAPATTSVPEPPSLLLFASSLLALGAMMGRVRYHSRRKPAKNPVP
jgi:hypothetical protein